jgi:hypothetical protein
MEPNKENENSPKEEPTNKPTREEIEIAIDKHLKFLRGFLK